MGRSVGTPSQADAGLTQNGIRPIQSVSLVPEVHARLQEYIIDNNLQPGDRLPSEAWLAAQMGVGRPLIREALRGLEAVGLIETRKGVGRFVRAFEVESYLGHFTADFLIRSFSIKDLAETRCLLEIAAISGAVEQLTDEDCDQIRTHLHDMRTAIEGGSANTDADIGMHRVIMSRADNTIIAALLDAVYSLTIAGKTRDSRPPEMGMQDLKEHEAIAAAATRRDGPAAREALIAHFETTSSRMGFRPLWRNVYGKERS
ncbi:MAG: FadR family transcriptional regulator [Thermomicrobiales bacterium]|nr:FadR family transcriptional regulator [Thermomicrobiales bacterium]MCO5220349.1 FCD domain-containing protein [Thermomicrobiales bacterium]